MSKLPLRVVFVVFLTCLLAFPSLSQETWYHSGPNGIGATVQTMLISPHDTSLVIIGVDDVGLYRSEDGGTTWQWSGEGLPVEGETIRDGVRVYETCCEPILLYADPVHEDWIWYLSKYPYHPEHVLFKSENRGESWESVNFPTDYEIFPRAIWIHPWYSDVMFVGGWRSLDGGQSWNLMENIGTENVYFYRQDPANQDKVYSGWCGNFINFTQDYGETWQSLQDESTISVGQLEISNINTNIQIMFGMDMYGNLHLDRSVTGGYTWSSLASQAIDWIEDNETPLSLSSDEWGNFYLVVEKGVYATRSCYRSQDNGERWYKMAGTDSVCGKAYEGNLIAVNPLNPNTILYEGPGRLYLSHDGGVSFDSTGPGLDNHTCNRMQQKPGTEELIIKYTYGYLSLPQTDSSWQWVVDSTLTDYYHPVYPDTQYAWIPEWGQAISYDDGETWTPFGFNLYFQPRFDPFDPEHVLGFGYSYLLNLIDFGITLVDCVDFYQSSGGETLYDAQFDPTQEGRIYASGRDQIFQSLDGGASYDAVYTLNERSEFIFQIIIHPEDGTIYCIERINAYYPVPDYYRIIRSDDHGVSFYEPDTTFRFEGVPHLTLSPVAPHPLVMAATSGVWYQPYGTDTWNLLPLPVNVRANYLLFSWDESTLHIGTAGRGVWSLTGFDFNSVEEQELHLLPSQLDLSAYPNPFNPSVTLTYAVPQRGDVTLNVYNVLGERVAQLVNGPLSAGVHEVTWNGINGAGQQVASGVYYVTLKANGATMTQKVVMVK